MNGHFFRVGVRGASARSGLGRTARRASGFTLMELLIVILIISILAAMALSALAGATELAREQRTRVIINKIDQLISEQYESYRTRAVPIRIPPGTSPQAAAGIRLNALRELMRLELPDRIVDLCHLSELGTNAQGRQIATISRFDAPRFSALTTTPALTKRYKRIAQRSTIVWTNQFESSECLYLIISSLRDGDKNAIDFFLPNEIADSDEDGMKEIVDAWGTPIVFIRWPASYLIDDGALTDQVADHTLGHADDPFDPLKVDPRYASGFTSWKDSLGNPVDVHPYALHPLIFSAGRDKSLGIRFGQANYTVRSHYGLYNDPYWIEANNVPPNGRPEEGRLEDSTHADNITNHYQSLQ